MHYSRAAAVVVVLLLGAGRATAQPSLRLPASAFLAGAAADWSTTYYSLGTGRTYEANPLISWAPGRVGKIAAGAAIDLGLTYAIVTIATHTHHTTAARRLLYVSAAFRFSLAGMNLYEARR